MTMETLPLFGAPEPERLKAPRTRLRPDGPAKWTPYRPKNPAKCDHCMAVLIETKGEGPRARSASFRRLIGATDELLCYEHAQLQRHEDGLPAYRAPRG